MSAGIYAIQNVWNGKLYIGSAVSIAKRWSRHISKLRNGKHHSPRLQNAWNKYGETSFEFCILEEVDCKTELVPLEQKYLDLYKSYDPDYGYNMSPTAGSTLGVKFTDAVKLHLSLAHKDKKISDGTLLNLRKMAQARMGKNLSVGTRLKISKAHMGKRHTAEHILNSAKAKIGKTLTTEHRLKISQSSMGKTLTAEHRLKISQSSMGRKHTAGSKLKISKAHIGHTRWVGKKHTAEARLKMSQTRRNKAWQGTRGIIFTPDVTPIDTLQTAGISPQILLELVSHGIITECIYSPLPSTGKASY